MKRVNIQFQLINSYICKKAQPSQPFDPGPGRVPCVTQHGAQAGNPNGTPWVLSAGTRRGPRGRPGGLTVRVPNGTTHKGPMELAIAGPPALSICGTRGGYPVGLLNLACPTCEESYQFPMPSSYNLY